MKTSFKCLLFSKKENEFQGKKYYSVVVVSDTFDKYNLSCDANTYANLDSMIGKNVMVYGQLNVFNNALKFKANTIELIK